MSYKGLDDVEMVSVFIVEKNATHLPADWMEFLAEEWEELQTAFANNDLVGVLDAICDIKYELNGLGIVLHMDLQAAFEEVQRSNMTKDRGAGDHKIRKGLSYSPPQLARFIEFPDDGK